MPVTFAWSTPGAALLATTTATGFPTAVGAFVVCGLLLALCGLVPWLGRLVRAIPAPLASAMLAGVLLTICVEPIRALVAEPLRIAPVVLTWVLLMRLARRWAVPGALAVAVLVTALDGGFARLGAGLGPTLEWVTPHFQAGAAVSIAVALFLVTMTSQNLAGAAVLGSFGYRPRLGPVLGVSGLASAAGAFAGGHASALEDEPTRIPASLTIVVAASGIAVLGVGAAFWGLVAGLLVLGVLSAPRAP